MAECQGKLGEKLVDQILGFCKRIAGSNPIAAICVCSDYATKFHTPKTVVRVLLIIHGFQPKLMNYMKILDEKTIIVIAADKWVFERDVDRGFLGEALAWGLVTPHVPLIDEKYLRLQEVKLKKRLVMELLENLALDYPEFSYGFRIKPEYFLYETALDRVRLFPPMIYGMLGLFQRNSRNKDTKDALQGYLEALKELEDEGIVTVSDGYVRISEDFANKAQSPKVRLVNLSKAVPRALFTSVLNIFPDILNAMLQNNEMLLKLQRIAMPDQEILQQIEDPEKYVYIPTASGLVPLANRMDIQAFARKILSTGREASVTIEPLGGILNDVYLVKSSDRGEEKKVVVKRFRDWSGIKWFPLLLWSVGTRTFAVLGRSRLERECAINQLLDSKGLNVPRLLHVSPDEHLVFMQYVKGENASKIIKRLEGSKTTKDARKELKIIKRIGKKLARVHSLGVSLGDAKPENIIIDENSEIFLTDFEQASRKGDKVWDVAEFLYYAGHDLQPDVGTRTAELIARAFVAGYLEAGGSVETVKKAAAPKYTKVFSVFTLPHVMFAISNVCRKADELKE